MDQSPKRKFYESESFKKLNDKWKKKLERSGFEDIERSVDGQDLLVNFSSGKFLQRNGTSFKDKRAYFESVEEYYRLAGQFFYDHEFKTDLDRRVWELHKDGMSMRDIVVELKRARIKTHKNHILEIISRLSQEMIRTAIHGQK